MKAISNKKTLLQTASSLMIAVSLVACNTSTNDSNDVSANKTDATTVPANNAKESKAKKYSVLYLIR